MKNGKIFKGFYRNVRNSQRRFISVLLVFCMMFTFIPIIEAPTHAAEMNALEAMGIDTSVAPEGFDAKDTSNPYGKDTVTLNPVEEIQVFGLEFNSAPEDRIKQKLTATKPDDLVDPEDLFSDYKERKTVEFESWNNHLVSNIYGHNDFTNDTTKTIMEAETTQKYLSNSTTSGSGFYQYLSGVYEGYYLQKENYNITNTLTDGDFVGETIAATKIAKGNFDGNDEGKTAQNVAIYTGKFSQDGGLYMRIGNAVDVDSSHSIGYGSKKFTLIPSIKVIGNPKEMITDVTEDFANDPYLMNNYLQVTTGDFDGNGIDEIAVFIPEYNGSRIVVYRLKSITGGADYKNPDDWELAWTYSLKESGYVSNMVSLVAGDFNEDGIDDLGATWGYYYGPDNNKGSRAVVMFGATGNMLQKSQEFSLEFDHPKYGVSDIVRGSFIFGDLFGGGKEVLVLGGQSAADIEKGNTNSRYVATYIWNGKNFERTIEKNFDLFETDDDGNLIYTSMNRSPRTFYSSPSNPANLAIAKQGLSETPYLYLDSLKIQSTDAGLDLIGPLDLTNQPDSKNPQYYVEYGATSGDLVGFGYETIITMQQTLSRIENIGEVPTSYSIFASWIHRLLGIKWYYPAKNYVPKFIPGKTYYNVMDFDTGYNSRTETDYSTSVCMQNTDDDTTYLKYTNKHYFRYSDPQVLAVLASPPYFSDLLDRDDLSGSYGESTTSYSSTKGEGGADTFNSTIEAGVYVGFEHDFEVFGVKVASIEAEVAVTGGFTYETEESSMLEQTVTYTTVAGQDTVAFYSIPLEIYEYSAFIPDGKGGHTEQKMSVNIPRTANVVTISLEDYEDIAKDYEVLPQISGTILTHTPGDPFTYSTSENGYKQPLVYDGEWSGVKFSDVGASISQEIAMTEESSQSYNFFGRIDTKVGGGVGDIKAGVTLGAEVGGGWVDVSTSGNSFSGEVYTMPSEAEAYGYGYDWKIFSYLYDNNGMQFPVVSYLVNNVIAPASLPHDFAQNVEKTTDNAIALTWTYDKMVAGFQIYRYYEFPDGSGSYEHKFISMDKGKLVDGVYEFEFVDENLSPYTDYNYQIQTVRASFPNNSIPSKVLTARTKSSYGYPEYSIQGDFDEKDYLRIYPDSQSTVKVIIDNIEDYNGNVSYQWQKFEDGKWININGRETDSLTFIDSGVANQAKYRCRTNVIYYDEARGNEYYISSYSPEFSTVYSKRIPEKLDFTATYFKDDEQNSLNLSIKLISGNDGHNTAPSGNVTFTVKGTDYNADYTVKLAAAGTEGNKLVSLSTIQLKNLADGVYEISAYYGGDRIFKSLSVDDITALVGDSGYQLILQTGEIQSVSYTYGDMITPVLKEYKTGNLKGTIIENGINYELYKVDGGSQIALTFEDKSYKTPDVGGYRLQANLEDGTSIEREFTVIQKDITINALNQSAGAGNVSSYPPTLELDESTPMAFDENLGILKLDKIARNTADKIITLNDETDPGSYTIIGNPSDLTLAGKYNNYNVTFVEGTYTIIGATYEVTMKANQYKGRDVGTIELSVNNRAPLEGEKFSASTALLFIAKPYEGYEVDQWNITKTDGGTPITDFTELTPNIISYILKSENTHVEVSFKKAEITLDIIKEGKGSVKASDPAFVSGAIVGTGAEIDFMATAEEGYTFKEWRIEAGTTKVEQGTLNDDGSNTLKFTMGGNSTRLNAIFVRDSYKLNLSENLEAVYKYKDIDDNELEKVVYDGALIVGDTSVAVRVKAGYELAEGAKWLVNDAEVVVDPSTGYIFNIAEDTTVLVDTVQQFYTLTTESANGSISVKINGDDPVLSDGEIKNVAGGSKIVFTANPAHGYVFDKFTVTDTTTKDVIDVDRYTVKDNVLTINELGANITVEATFTQSTPYEITVTYGNRAEMVYTLYDSYGAEVKTGGVATGKKIEVYGGDKIKLELSTNTGYMVDKWTVDGIVDDTSSRTKILENISKGIVVSVDIISQVSYTVTYGVGSGDGSIGPAKADGREFVSGDTDVGGNSELVIPAIPANGQMVSHWTFNGETIYNKDGKKVVNNILTIEKLNSPTPIVDIQVHFKPVEVIYNIIVIQANGGTIDAILRTDRNYQAVAGEKVMIKQAANLDYTFEGWNVNNGSITHDPETREYELTMPDGDVTVSAEFVPISTVIADIHVFDTNLEAPGGHNGTYSVRLDREGVDGYPRDISSGVTTTQICNINRAYTDAYVSWPVTNVVITAHPDEDYRVLKWTVNGAVQPESTNEFTIPILQDTETNLDVIVQFEQIGEEITYGVDGVGGSITSIINDGTGNEFISGNTISSPTSLSFTAQADNGYEIEAWYVNGDVIQSGNISTFEYNALVGQGADIKVRFARVPFNVVYSGINGVVTSAQVASGGTVRGGTQVTFTATANPGYEFDYFEVNGVKDITSTGTLTMTIEANTEVTAHFKPYANSQINFSISGNGSISATKGGLLFKNGEMAAGNETIIFTAQPAENYRVKEWIVDGVTIKGDINTYSLLVSKVSHSVSVEFEESNYVVNFSSVGNGTITASLAGNSIDSGSRVLKGSNIVFTATPAPGYQVKGWKLDGIDVENSAELLSYTLPTIADDSLVTVEFMEIPKYEISISITGTGEGTINAFVNGNETPIVAGSIIVNNHDVVELIATPFDEYNNATWTVLSGANEVGENSVRLTDVVSDINATVKFGVAELITVEAYTRSLDAEPAKGNISVKAGYGTDLETLNAVGTPIKMTKGKTVEFTAIPSISESGYMVEKWVINGEIYENLSNTISLVPKTNIKAEVYFEPIVGFTIPTSGENYTITIVETIPDDVSFEGNKIRKNGTLIFSVSPADGYYLKELEIFGVNCLNGANKQTKDGGIVSAVEDNGVYTITVEKITKDIECTITAVKPVITITSPTNGTITVSYVGDLTITNGEEVPVGTELTLKAVANSGYQLSSWGYFASGKSGSLIKLIVPHGDFTISATFVSSPPVSGPIPIIVKYTIDTFASIGGSISPESATVDVGGSQLFSIIPEKGYEISDVLVNGKSIGAVSSYTFTNIQKNSSIEAVFSKSFIPDSSTQINFNDVDDDDWFSESVRFVVGLGLFKGTSEDGFSPNLSMTRGMFVTALGRLYEYMNDLGLDQSEGLSFNDVPLNMYYSPSVKWASGNGIISGYENGEFRPDEPITREQIVAIIHRFAIYAGLDTSSTSDLDDFSDGDGVSSWALEAMRWAVDLGIIGGRADGTIDPQGLAQRAEVAAIIHRFLLTL